LEANGRLREDLDEAEAGKDRLEEECALLRADQVRYHQNLTETAQRYVKDLDTLDAFQKDRQRLEAEVDILRAELAVATIVVRKVHDERDTVITELAAARQRIHDKSILIDVVHQERDAARQDADRQRSLANDLGVRLESSQADTELLRTHLISARQDAERVRDALLPLLAWASVVHNGMALDHVKNGVHLIEAVRAALQGATVVGR
jgi:hypothetical protein